MKAMSISELIGQEGVAGRAFVSGRRFFRQPLSQLQPALFERVAQRLNDGLARLRPMRFDQFGDSFRDRAAIKNGPLARQTAR